MHGRRTVMLTIEEFEELANELYDEIPPQFLEGLSGGIIISEEAEQRDPDLPDVYILGEYVEDHYGLGRYIVLYYGSFAALFADEPFEVWEDELWETMVHEIRHHVESLAGVHDLDIEDAIQLAEFRRWAQEMAEGGYDDEVYEDDDEADEDDDEADEDDAEADEDGGDADDDVGEAADKAGRS